jgi:hypothetical protein
VIDFEATFEIDTHSQLSTKILQHSGSWSTLVKLPAKMGQAGSQLLSEIEQNSNCAFQPREKRLKLTSSCYTVSGPEIQRLKKRFMKLDKDGSGSIDKDEFLQIPAIANNPLALRMIAIFDEEWVLKNASGRRSRS